MGWFDTVLNIGSTIGKVCGALQGGNNSAAHLGEAGSINNALGGLVFYYDTTVSGSPLTAANQTANQTTVVLTFLNNPLVGNLAQQVTLPYMSKIPIGPAFNTASSGGNENFTSTFTPPASNEGGGETAGLSGVMVQAACNSLLSSGSTIQVGSYFTASLNGNAISIGTLGSFTLNGVLHVDVRASGGNLAQVILTVGGTPPQGGTVTVNVPLGLDISDGIPYINILGSIGTNPNFSDINADYVVKHSSLVDADIILIRQLQPAW